MNFLSTLLAYSILMAIIIIIGVHSSAASHTIFQQPQNGISNQTANTPIIVNTIFTETGLKGGIQWYLTYNGVSQNAITPNTIVFSTQSGIYGYSLYNIVSNGTTYIPSFYSGNLIAGSTKTMSYAILVNTTPSSNQIVSYFNETGLPSNILWTVTYGNVTAFAYTPNKITFNTQNGTYAFSISPISINGILFTPKLAKSSIAAGLQENVNFTIVTTFSETGLPAGAPWVITYGNVSMQGHSPNNITFSNANYGNYSFVAYTLTYNGISYNPSVYSGNIATGGSRTIAYIQNSTSSSTSSTSSSTSTSTSTTSSTTSTTSTTTTIPASNSSAQSSHAQINPLLSSGDIQKSNAIATTQNVLLTLPSGLENYFFGIGTTCGRSSSCTSGQAASANYTTQVGQHAAGGTSSNRWVNYTIIGNTAQAVNNGNVVWSGGAVWTDSLVGEGANVVVVNGNIVTNSVSSATASALQYTVGSANSLVLLFFTSAGNALNTPALPSGCNSWNIAIQLKASAFSTNCIQAAGTYTVSLSDISASKGKSQIASAAYIFPPYSVSFNAMDGGSVTEGGTTLTNQTYNVIGTATLNAIIPSGYTFSGWTTSSPTGGTDP